MTFSRSSSATEIASETCLEAMAGNSQCLTLRKSGNWTSREPKHNMHVESHASSAHPAGQIPLENRQQVARKPAPHYSGNGRDPVAHCLSGRRPRFSLTFEPDVEAPGPWEGPCPVRASPGVLASTAPKNECCKRGVEDLSRKYAVHAFSNLACATSHAGFESTSMFPHMKVQESGLMIWAARYQPIPELP